MAKLTTSDLTSLTNESSAVSTINSNFTAVETAMENTLSRDGTTPNTMSADIDLNGNDLLNVGSLSLSGGATLSTIVGYAEEWANKAEDSLVSTAAGGDGVDDYSALHWSKKAEDEKTAAEAAKTAAEAAQAAAEAVYDTFDDRYLGAKASDPATDNDGDPLADGDLYYNTTANEMRVYDLGTTTWLTAAISSATVVTKTSSTGSATLPSGTTAQRDGSPVNGYLRYNSDTSEFEGYAGGAWGQIGGGAGYFKGENGTVGSSAGDIFRVNEAELNTNVTIDAAENASAAGPLSVATGVTLTVSGTLVIL